ncbi:hypothetical protein J8F10_13030 [Gemmata sp. G18]|uniref:PEP-CTERM sorting domain-containing protein n=1 Tax=Gemmata palustris TaxID=2822762 RepID=A0ABS5BR41_9BACT|nr:hypothetical protein [Gemmata palustris]MBP3956207.1 hypothetical protein [Gemmata palustris]
MPLSRRFFAALTLLLFAQAPTARAGFIIYSGSDAGASSGSPRPNSDAAAAAFDAAAGALGAVSVIDFESAPLGAFASLNAAPGVTITGAGGTSGPPSILDAPTGTPDAIYGYNTTAGGARFLYTQGGTVTVTFGTGVQAFGAYISGIQFSGETITFNDGSSQTVDIPGLTAADGGIAFVGFTDAGKSITSITFNLNGTPGGPDFIAIDDVRFVHADSVTATPAPSGLVLAATGGFMGLFYARRRPRTAPAA